MSQNSSFSYSHEVRTQRSQASSPAAGSSPRPSVVGHTGQRARGDGQDRDAGSNRSVHLVNVLNADINGSLWEFLDCSFVVLCVSVDHGFPCVVLICDLLSVNLHRGGGAVQANSQSPQSPADVAYLGLPDVGVEDVLELQFQQLTVAQFTVATMEHAIPLLKTGRILN